MLKSFNVMVAGIGGASLGTELIKALNLAGKYNIFGCDIASTAYGLYDTICTKTYHISSKNYITNVIDSCLDAKAQFIVPGGEQPMKLLGAANAQLKQAGIQLLGNDPNTIELFSNKKATFEFLASKSIPIPKTIKIESIHDIEYVGLPCIVKPATGSGGSVGVFFAVSVKEAMMYAKYIRNDGVYAVAQEYIPHDEGEFSFGVLSLPDETLVGSIALRRTFDTKISVTYKGRGGIISSPYSQGHVKKYTELRQQAEKIAKKIHSKGPINIQGRVRDGILYPFEINPRFSGSVYLRSIAGFNEIERLIDYYNEIPPKPIQLKYGWYLRSLTECYIPENSYKKKS
ncbi:ATP-grasp domain-containing protein [Maridesulfovibrio ferrireducens]|uniref:ATP-grasp domain-containing protein n=1 Tax=Maridesulfovibrio ferrireducens TaxID=246191 RepID=UPI001A19FD36|nr:ATP-grasp domain-containing protein [Maridesulfovibrio ferrireducens]MBI9113152.1 ATP-grasp domain-containing protein [Maridesulfovibrio ferrireducens]